MVAKKWLQDTIMQDKQPSIIKSSKLYSGVCMCALYHLPLATFEFYIYHTVCEWVITTLHRLLPIMKHAVKFRLPIASGLKVSLCSEVKETVSIQ